MSRDAHYTGLHSALISRRSTNIIQAWSKNNYNKVIKSKRALQSLS